MNGAGHKKPDQERRERMVIKRYLTKAFWDYQAEVHPEMMKEFRAFCDNYKDDNDWNKLFNAGWSRGYSQAAHFIGEAQTVAPKIHDLPDAMQMGIFMAWQATKDEDPIVAGGIDEGVLAYITDVLQELEEQHEE